MKRGDRIRVCLEMYGFNKCVMLIGEDMFKLRIGKFYDLGSMVFWVMVE